MRGKTLKEDNAPELARSVGHAVKVGMFLFLDLSLQPGAIVADPIPIKNCCA
jgi:hypothetical protein